MFVKSKDVILNSDTKSLFDHDRIYYYIFVEPENVEKVNDETAG